MHAHIPAPTASHIQGLIQNGGNFLFATVAFGSRFQREAEIVQISKFYFGADSWTFLFNGKIIRAIFQKPAFELWLQTPFSPSSSRQKDLCIPPLQLLRLNQGQTGPVLHWSDEGQPPRHFILCNWVDTWRRWNTAVLGSPNNRLVPKVGLMDH